MADGGVERPTNRVQLDWALFSKAPGQRDDYGILYSSEQRVAPALMARMIRHFTPGSPGREGRGQPDELPWVTFTAAGVKDPRTDVVTPYVGVAIREWPENEAVEVDATGRTIVPTRYFCLDADTFAREVGSYLALYDAVCGRQPIDLRRQEGTGLLSLSVVRIDRRELLAGVGATRWEEIGGGREQTVAAGLAAASLLIDQPVTVAPSRFPDLRSRIAFLDVVAAMLPSGTVGALSAATWVDARTQHLIRLGFGVEYGDAKAATVNPAQPPTLDALAAQPAPRPAEPGPAGTGAPGGPSPGARYAALLSHLVGQDVAGAVPSNRLDGLVARLAADAEPRTFTRPDELPELLDGWAVRDLVDSARKDGSGRSRIRDFLRRIPKGGRRGELLGSLLVQPTQEDFALAVQHWALPVEPGTANLMRDLADAGHADPALIAAAPAEVAASIAGVLLTPRAGAPSPSTVSAGLAISLVLSRPRDAEAAWAPVRDQIAASPTLAMRTVLSHLDTRPGASPAELLTWLYQDRTARGAAALRSFAWLYSVAGRQLTQKAVSDLSRVEPPLGEEAVRTLLTLAVQRGRADEALPAIEEWLAAQGSFDAARQAAWRAVLEKLPDDRDRDRVLELIGIAPPKRWNVSVRFMGSRAKDTGRVAGSSTVPVRWITSSLQSQDGLGMTSLLTRTLPRPMPEPRSREFTFAGDGNGQFGVGFIERGPSQPSLIWRGFHGDYADLAAVGGRVRDLWRAAGEAVDSRQWPPTLALRPPDERAATLAERIESAGFPQILDVAARLLNAPVTVVAANGRPPLLDRLRFLELVLALLPAGASAALSVATWADDAGPFMFAFADRAPADGRHLVTWPLRRGVPESFPVDLAGHYARRILWAHAVQGDTATVIQSLAAFTQPLNLDEVESRLALVSSENPAFTAPPGREKKVAAARATMRALLTYGSGGVGEIATAIMDVLSDGSAADVELADQVVLRLTRDGTYTPIIVMLLGAKPLDRDRLARVHRALGKLIYANNLHQSEPQVLEALRKAPAAAVSLLVQADLAGSAPDCLRMLTWGGLIPELAPFHDVAIIGLRADEQRVREAEQFGPQAASLLKRLEERWSRPGGSSPPATGALGAPVAAPAGALDAAAGGVAGEGDKDVTP